MTKGRLAARAIIPRQSFGAEYRPPRRSDLILLRKAVLGATWGQGYEHRNPELAFTLVLPPGSDPLQVTPVLALTQLRRLLLKRPAARALFARAWAASQHMGRTGWRQYGPVTALRLHLRRWGWTWDSPMTLTTDQGISLHFLNTPGSTWKAEAQAAAFRERWRVLGIGSTRLPKQPREDLAGLLGPQSSIDHDATTALLRGAPHRRRFLLEGDGVKRLEEILAGAFRPNSRLYKAGTCRSPFCPFCPDNPEGPQEETKEHCFWECPAWSAVRTPFLQLLNAIGFYTDYTRPYQHRAGPPGLWQTGIIHEDPRLLELLSAIPEDGHSEVGTPLRPEDGAREEFETDPLGIRRVVVAGDGSGLHPRDRRLRRCGYSCYYGPQHSRNYEGKLLGTVQVVPRAELRAVLRVLRTEDRPFLFLSDCLAVVNGVRTAIVGGDVSSLEHQDLWTQVVHELSGRPRHDAEIRWVKAHTTAEDEANGLITPRDRRLNAGADDAAKRGAARHHLP